MSRSIPLLFAPVFAASLVLVPSVALAGPGPDSCFLTSSGNCMYVPPAANCEAQCTPGNFVASCDGACNVDADASCTGTCEADCNTSCTTNPGSFQCTGYCETSCQAGCMSKCNSTDTECISDCTADCSNRCAFECSATPPTVDCTTQCQASCNASCQVEVNIDCHAMCTSTVELPKCQAACATSQGGLFCDGQFIDLTTAVQDCITYLESQGITVSESCSANSATGTSSCSATVGCSAAPSRAADDRWGAVGITGLMMGLGLAVSRRRRR